MEASDLIGMAQISLRGGMKTGIKDQDPHIMGMRKGNIEIGMNSIGLGKGILERGIILGNIENPHMEREMKMEDLGDSIRTKVLEVEIIKEMAAIALEAL